jgi:protoheme IX farnesyltransferase
MKILRRGIMSKEQTLSQPSSRVSFKELQQIIKMGLVQGNLIPAFAGAWLAVVMSNHSFLSSIPQILLMLIGSTLIMGGACALNNYYDQDIDRIMPSKQNRPTVNDRISDKNLLILSFGMMLLGEACLFLLNVPSGVLGLIGIVGYVSYYSIWSKRHTTWNTVVGSFPGAVPPLIGWVAIDGNISLIAIALFLVVFCWQPIHFYALAIKRSDEYSLANIPMLPSVKGFKRTRISMFIWLVFLLPLPFLLSSLGTTFVVLATLLNLGWLYVGLTSFKKATDQTKWATKMFIYSLNYLVVFFVLVVVISLIKMI